LLQSNLPRVLQLTHPQRWRRFARSDSVSVAPRVDCMTTKVAIAAQYASGICTSRAMMTDTVTATAVRMACAIQGRFFLSPAQNFISQSSSSPVRIGKITSDQHGLQLEFCKQTSTPKAFASRHSAFNSVRMFSAVVDLRYR
jgi:hypothetical protein